MCDTICITSSLRKATAVTMFATFAANIYGAAMFGSNLDPLGTTLFFALAVVASFFSATFLVAGFYRDIPRPFSIFFLVILGICLMALGSFFLFEGQDYKFTDSEKEDFIKAMWNKCCSARFGSVFLESNVIEVQNQLSSGVCNVVDLESRRLGGGECEGGSSTFFLESMFIFLETQFNVYGGLNVVAGTMTFISASCGFPAQDNVQQQSKRQTQN